MTDLGYLLWLVATAAMTITVLTVGTLAAAGLLTRSPHDREPHREAGSTPRLQAPQSETPTPTEHQRAA